MKRSIQISEELFQKWKHLTIVNLEANNTPSDLSDDEIVEDFENWLEHNLIDSYEALQ